MPIDPVCGMTVEPAKAAGHAEHGGMTYHFCSAGCLGKFKADPARYATHADVRKPCHGHRTDVAMESAGVTLVKGDLRGIARAALLSRATMRNIRQDLAFAFGYNALGTPWRRVFSTPCSAGCSARSSPRRR